MADHRLEVLRLGAARIAQVDLVVQAHCGHASVRIERVQHGLAARWVRDVVDHPGRGDELLHLRDGGGLVVVRSLVHDLRARSFGEPHEAGSPQIELGLLRRDLLGGPGEHFGRDEVGLADERDPRERVLVQNALPVERFVACPPQAFERRHRVVEVAVGLPGTHLRHLDGVREGVQQAHRTGVRAVFLVRVARAGHGDEAHGRHVDELGLGLRQVEVLVLFLEIERHASSFSSRRLTRRSRAAASS